MLVHKSFLLLSKNRNFIGISVRFFKPYGLFPKEPFRLKPFSWDRQSVLLPGSERIRASIFQENPNEYLCKIPGAPQIQTVYDVLEHGKEVSEDGECLGTKNPQTGEYEWTKYSEVISKVQHIGSGFLELGLRASNETFVGIFAVNREEFFYTLYACCGYSMVLVPVYPSIGLKSILYIINQAQSSALIVNNAENGIKVLKNLKEIPSVKTLLFMDAITPEVSKEARGKEIKMLNFSEIEELGRKNKKDLVLPNPDDLCIIPYTSGTTGFPKGVMLTHKSIIAETAAIIVGYGEAGRFGGTIISYLPPAHIYEIVNQIASIYFARRIAFFNEEIKNLMPEVRRLQPDILPFVPRILNAIYMNVMNSVKSSYFKRLLLQLAVSRKEKLLQRGIVTKNSIWDKLVLRKFQEAIGKDCHMVLTTSAPLADDVARFFRCASGSYMNEAYGQTEVMGCVMTLPKEVETGHVGCPMPCNHIKLVDVPEMGYLAKDDIGEICVRGTNVFKGYFKNEEATKESLIDGWQHTGDIGRWLPNGALKIIDRKKHLFKLQQGEYIAPEKVEVAYSSSNLVAQIFVDGLSDQNYIIVLVVPNVEAVKEWMKSKKLEVQSDLKATSSDKEIRRSFLLELRNIGSQADLNSLEQARNIAIITEPFSIENELLSPTFKLKRNFARKYFEKTIQQLYREGPIV